MNASIKFFVSQNRVPNQDESIVASGRYRFVGRCKSKFKVFVLLLIVFVKDGILIVDDLIFEQNNSFIDAKINFFNEPLKDSILAGTLKTLLKFSGAWVYVTVSLPANRHDREYKTMFMRTVVDVKRLMSGIYANPLLKSAVDNLLEAIDFEIKFPFPVVSM